MCQVNAMLVGRVTPCQNPIPLPDSVAQNDWTNKVRQTYKLNFPDFVASETRNSISNHRCQSE